MKKLFIIIPLLFLIGCSDSHNQNNLNSTEPTLQSAEDANTKEFTEESFR